MTPSAVLYLYRLNSCISTNYFCGDFLYFFKHVYKDNRLLFRYQVFLDTTEYAQNVLQMLLKINYIFYLNAQNTLKTENQCCLKLQLYVVTLEI